MSIFNSTPEKYFSYPPKDDRVRDWLYNMYTSEKKVYFLTVTFKQWLLDHADQMTRIAFSEN